MVRSETSKNRPDAGPSQAQIGLPLRVDLGQSAGPTTEPTPDTRTRFMQQARTRWLSKVDLSAEIEFRDSLPKTLVDKHSKRRTSGPSAQRKANLLG